MWIWDRVRGDIADARQRASDAEKRPAEEQRKNAEAEARHQAAQAEAAESLRSTAALRSTVRLNGFTKMLQESWGKRGHA